jgi:hypothetical protein
VDKKLSMILATIGRALGTAAVRDYAIERLSSISPDDLIKAIDSMDVDLMGKLTDRERKVAKLLATKFGDQLDKLTLKNVFMWIATDQPFIAGVIYGHPRGMEWLNKVLEGLKGYVRSAGEERYVPIKIAEG